MAIMTSFLLRAAALLIPQGMRAEWLAEWQAEVWYVRERSKRSATLFCMGAFPDAVCVWRSTPCKTTPLHSPIACTLLLAAISTVCVTSICLLPGGLSAQLPSMDKDARNLVMLWRDGHPWIATDTFQALQKIDTRRHFSATALYERPVKRQVDGRMLSVSRSTASLLDVLNLPTPAAKGSTATVVLTRTGWRKHFNADPKVIGTTLDIAGEQTYVAGVIADQSWSLVGGIDAWLIDDEFLEQGGTGFALARLAPQQSGRIRLPLRLLARQVTDRFSQARQNFLFLTLLACLILPVTTSFSLGELPPQANRRWGFLLTKLSLVLIIAYCAAAYLAYLLSTHTGSPLLLHVYLPTYVFALRWVIQDQRSRCPVCLRYLSNPASIGESSRIFLTWNVTEWICSRGHGLMHIPETPTSWFAVQRWSALDASWRGLFTR